MRNAFAIALFAILLTAVTFKLDVSLGPGLSVKNLFLYALLGLLVLDAVLARRVPTKSADSALRLTRLHALIIALILYATASTVAVLLAGGYALPAQPGAPGLRDVVLKLKTQVMDPYIFLLVSAYASKSAGNATRAIYAALLMVAAANLLTVVDVLNMPSLGIIEEKGSGRVQGPLGEQNQYGAFIVYFLPVMIGAIFSKTGVQRILFAGGAAISLMALLMTASRGAVAGLIVGSVISTVLLRKHLTPAQVVRFAVIGVVVAVLIIAALAGPFGNLLYEHFIAQSENVSLSESGLESVSSGRVAIWSLGIQSMLVHPWSFITGYGWGAFDALEFYASHNTYLEYFYDLGVIGLALFVAIWIEILRICKRSLETVPAEEARRLLFSFVFAVTSLLVSQFFVNLSAAIPFIWSYLGFMLGLSRQVTANQANAPARADAAAGFKARSA